MKDSEEELFKFMISEQGQVCLIVLIGDLGLKNKESYTECINQIKESKCRFFVINLREVELIPRASHRFLVQLQREVREKEGSKIRVCCVNPKFKPELTDHGIIRNQEIANNVKKALESF